MLLFSEYRFFQEQSKKLLELQEDYKNYISTVRKAFENQKEKSDKEVETIIEEKKKPFIVINREKNYLKQSFLDYVKKKNLGDKFKSMHGLFSEKFPIKENNRHIKNKRKLKKQNLKKTIFKPFFNEENVKKEAIFMWPIKHKDFWISSFFGVRKVKKGYSFHYGLDLAAMKGTIVKAVASGKILQTTYSSGYGNTILIQHDSKYKTRYAHLNSIEVKSGQQVTKGQRIGTVGDTGSVRSSGKDASHLHFEVYAFGKQINPLYVLQ